jgi:mannitol/fructose-specific phosphotransferase system IIA component (Ntr-type)
MLSQYLVKNGVMLDPKTRKKWHLLEELTRAYCGQNFSEETLDQILETVLIREIRVSTGLGGGVAIPHARTNLVFKTGVLFVRFKDGIEWNSMDGSLVNFLFLVIGPTASTEEYLFVLSKISKLLSRKSNRVDLLSATDEKEILEIISGGRERERQRHLHL